MIVKQSVVASFRDKLIYNEKKIREGFGELIGTNMLGDCVRTLASEYALISSLKPNVSKAVYYTSLSIAPDEQLSNTQFREIVEKYLDEMGFGNSQYVIYRHTDQKHPHVHIIANRIDMDGNVVSDKWNYKRSEKIVRELEKEYGLKQVVSSDKTEDKALSKGQIEYLKRTGEVPIKVQLQTIVKEALPFATDKDHLQGILSQMGADVKYHENKSGKVYGVSFELDGVCFKGSDLGRAYSWNKINAQLNNERNSKVSQGEDFRENRNIGSAGRTLAEYEQEEYSRVNGSASAYKLKSQRLNYQFERGGNQYSRNTNSLQKTVASGREDVKGTRIFDKNNEMDCVSSCNSKWFDDRDSNIFDSVHQLSNQLGFQEEKLSDDDKRKKKRKEKGKEQENSNGMNI